MPSITRSQLHNAACPFYAHHPKNDSITEGFSAELLGNFFITDDSLHCIFRTDSVGNMISRYGQDGYFGDGYAAISDISGYVDQSGTAHLYVSDGSAERLDHLTATTSKPNVEWRSSATAADWDSAGMNLPTSQYVPGKGVFGFDPITGQLLLWTDTDSLSGVSRSVQDWSEGLSKYAIRTLCGRLISVTVGLNGLILRSYTISGLTPDNPVPLPTHHWTLANSPVLISYEYHVGNGDTLTIDPGVDVQFARGAGFVIDGGGRLVANGNSNSRVTFHSAHSGDNWVGMKVSPGGNVSLSYSTITGTDSFCLFADTPIDNGGTPVFLDHCHLDGTTLQDCADVLRILGKPTYTMYVANSRIDNAVKGRGVYLYNCSADFFGDTIQSCDTANTYLKQVTGKFRNSIFKGHASGHGILFEGPNCTPNFQCCVFQDMSPWNGTGQPLLALKGAAPSFGWEDNSSGGVSNVISDSASTLLHFYDDKVMPIIDNVIPSGGPGGKNDWYQHLAGGRYLYWENGTTSPRYSAQNQYWNNGVNNGYFFPSPMLSYFAVDTTDKNPWGLCGSGQGLMSRRANPRTPSHGGQGLDDLESDLALFTDALTAEQSGSYASAQDQFHGVVSVTASSDLRWQALTHIVSTQRHLSGEIGDGWIPALVDSVVALDSSSYATRTYGKRLSAAYRTDREQFPAALAICTDLLSSGLTYEDSLLVAIDLIGIQMLADSGSGSGGLDSPPGAAIPTALQIHSIDHALRLERDLLRQLTTHSRPGRGGPALPTKYVLYQNYPNPFNPTTEIRFDLPEATRVELKIFNTLGQLVSTLTDEVRPAGAYTVTWNGQSQSGASVATGLYIYQIKTASFTDSKKMLLIR